MALLIPDPNVVVVELTRPFSSQNTLEAFDQLYALHYPTVRRLESEMEHFHNAHRELFAPVACELFDRASQGKIILGDDFIDNFYQRTHWLYEKTKQIRKEYERQYRATSNLVKMI